MMKLYVGYLLSVCSSSSRIIFPLAHHMLIAQPLSSSHTYLNIRRDTGGKISGTINYFFSSAQFKQNASQERSWQTPLPKTKIFFSFFLFFYQYFHHTSFLHPFFECLRTFSLLLLVYIFHCLRLFFASSRFARIFKT